MCLIQIYGYKQLITEVSELRAMSYDPNNSNHSEMLRKLWNRLHDNEMLSGMITKQWAEIGFQGEDPSTDFRGMGILGLMNLSYFADHYIEAAKQILQHSLHPVHG